MGECIIRIKISVQLQTKGAIIVACWDTLLLCVKTKESSRHVKAEFSHSDYSNESSEAEDNEEEFYVGSIVIDNSTENSDDNNVAKEYVVEQSNTNSDDQQNTDETIDEAIIDVKSEVNKEEKLHDEPELVFKEDKQEGKPKVNQNEHNAETMNAGDNQKEMAPKDDCGQDTAEETEELFVSALENQGETESDFSRSQWQLPLKTFGMYVTYTLG